VTAGPRFRRLAPGFRFRHVAAGHDTTPALEREVAGLWREAGVPGAVDDLILSVVAIGEAELTARTVHYRYFAAQRARPGLFPRLNIRPLAVSGVVSIGGAFLFGERGPEVAQDPGAIELVPSGGVGPSKIRPDGTIDVAGQLLAELVEETGFEPPGPPQPTIVGLIEDPLDRVVDIVCSFALGCTFAELREAHARRGGDEYSRLFLVESGSLPALRAAGGKGICAATRAIIDSYLCSGSENDRANRHPAPAPDGDTAPRSSPVRAKRRR
jgi:hypothetical protein